MPILQGSFPFSPGWGSDAVTRSAVFICGTHDSRNLLNGVSHSQYYCHSGPTVLHCEGCSVHCREADQHFCPLSTNCDNKKCHQCLRTLPNSLWGGGSAKSPTFENHCFKIHFID